MKKLSVSFRSINGPAFDSILLALIQIVTYAANIVTTKILAVEFSLTEYGTYSTVNSVITLAASLTLFGLGDTINYYYNRKDSCENTAQREEYVNTIFFVQLYLGAVVSGILAVFAGPISNYYHNLLVKPLVLTVCLKPWLSNATHLYQVLFVSSGRAKFIALRNLVLAISKVVMIYAVIKIFDSLFVIFLCLVLLDVLQLVIFSYIFGKIRFRIHIFSFSCEKLGPVIKYALPMGVYFVTLTVMREIDKLVIGWFGTTEELAIYSNCAKTLPLNLLTVSFSTVMIPFIMKNVSSRNYQKTAQIMKKYLTIGYLSVWMFSGALLLCASEAIQFFYSEEYIVGHPVFVLYILDGMVQFASVHLIIAANGDTKFLMRTALCFLMVNAVLSVFLYIILDALGASILGPAIATVLVSLLYVSVMYSKSAQILQTRIQEFVPIKRMVTYLCELGMIGIVFYYIKSGLQTLQLHWVFVFLLIAACYCAVVVLIHLKEYINLFVGINQLRHSDR